MSDRLNLQNGTIVQYRKYPATKAVYVQLHPQSRVKVLDLAAVAEDFRGQGWHKPDGSLCDVFTLGEQADYTFPALLDGKLGTLYEIEFLTVTGEPPILFLPFEYFCVCGYAWESEGDEDQIECAHCKKRQPYKLASLRFPRALAGVERFWCSDCQRWALGKDVCRWGADPLHSLHRPDEGCPHCYYQRSVLLSYSDMGRNIGASMQFGGSCLEWTENRVCLACNQAFEIYDSSY